MTRNRKTAIAPWEFAKQDARTQEALMVEMPPARRAGDRLPLRRLETWQQDPADPDLWHGQHGVILNTAALEERGRYFDIVRLLARGY